MLKDNKGITLASLVITIIVLVILASVATVSGVGTVNYIKFNNAKAQFQAMQSNVNSWYEESKNNAEVLNYGEDIGEADATILDEMSDDLGIDFFSEGYRYFSANYIKNTFDIDGIDHDFLINISTRTVLIFGGVEYNGNIYYSAKAFGINIVEDEEISSNIMFDMISEAGEIIIYNIKFPNDRNISKYNVQYKLSTEDTWNTLTSDKKGKYEYTDSESNTVTDNNAWYIEADKNGNYEIKITTASDEMKSDVKTLSIEGEKIIFVINDTEYTAYDNMTWRDFVGNEDLNIDDWVISDEGFGEAVWTELDSDYGEGYYICTSSKNGYGSMAEIMSPDEYIVSYEYYYNAELNVFEYNTAFWD